MRVMSELLRRGLEVYRTCCDDVGIDCVICHRPEGLSPVYVDVQVKGYNGYSRVVGLYPDKVRAKTGRYIVVLAFFFTAAEGKKHKPDEFYALSRVDVLRLREEHPPDPSSSDWGDLLFNKPERQAYAHQDLDYLTKWIKGGSIPEEWGQR
jgi:hypothetical protein